MIINTAIYDLLLGLDFLIKIGHVVNVKKEKIQVRQGVGNNIQILPLNMVNMLQIVKEKVQPKSNVNAMMMLEGPRQVAIIDDVQFLHVILKRS
jgi:hypothetical protein